MEDGSNVGSYLGELFCKLRSTSTVLLLLLMHACSVSER